MQKYTLKYPLHQQVCSFLMICTFEIFEGIHVFCYLSWLMQARRLEESAANHESAVYHHQDTMTTSGKISHDWLVVSCYVPILFPRNDYKNEQNNDGPWPVVWPISAGTIRTSIWGSHHTSRNQAGRETLQLSLLKDCQGHLPLVALLTAIHDGSIEDDVRCQL